VSAWKACDVRGLFPSEVSPDLFRRIGAAVGRMLAMRPRVLVGGDFRESTPELKRCLIDGLTSTGAQVLDVGQVPTPIAYFAHRHFQTDAVLIVTASHNPPNHNGLKLMIGSLPPSEEDFERLRTSATAEQSRPVAAAPAQGASLSADPIPAYREWILGRWAGGKPIRVVLDAGNGAWSELGPAIFEELGFDVRPLYCEVDGSFPNRPPDSARPANLAALREEVRRTDAKLGIAWDGDGDRVAFVDEGGAVVSADEMAVLLIRHLLRAPAQRVVYDIKLSDVVRRTTLEQSGEAIMERSGHSFIKRQMIEMDCLFGCEVSGHYFFRELGGGDDGLFTALLVSRMVADCGALGMLRKSVPPVFATPDLRLPAGLISYGDLKSRLLDLFSEAGRVTLDGIRLETADGFILARESVTEPVITMRLEGLSRDAYHRLLGICLQALPEVSRKIREQVGQVEG
jgi:phosphomannomutase/phosphoglucomutase